MTENETDLEAALRAMGRRANADPTPDVMPAVLARIEGLPARGATRLRRIVRSTGRVGRWQRRTAVAITALCAGVVGLAVSPAGSNLRSWVPVPGVLVERQPAQPGNALGLGRRASITAAQRTLRGRVPLPIGRLGQPQASYVGGTTEAQIVSFVWRPRAGLPATATAPDVGLLVSAFESSGEIVVRKGIAPGTIVSNVRLKRGGRTIDGTWLAGEVHEVSYLGPDGTFSYAPVFLAGDVLLWREGPLTVRMESALGRDATLRLAGSFQ